MNRTFQLGVHLFSEILHSLLSNIIIYFYSKSQFVFVYENLDQILQSRVL